MRSANRQILLLLLLVLLLLPLLSYCCYQRYTITTTIKPPTTEAPTSGADSIMSTGLPDDYYRQYSGTSMSSAEASARAARRQRVDGQADEPVVSVTDVVRFASQLSEQQQQREPQRSPTMTSEIPTGNLAWKLREKSVRIGIEKEDPLRVFGNGQN
ncbi:unnamed protein product [Sympodiomycopsis kandeliae]